MGSIPRDHDERVRFDAFCKAVLRNEARNHMRDLRRQRSHGTSLDAVPQEEIGSLLGMSKSTVQRRRTKTLDGLRAKLTALMPKGG